MGKPTPFFFLHRPSRVRVLFIKQKIKGTISYDIIPLILVDAKGTKIEGFVKGINNSLKAKNLAIMRFIGGLPSTMFLSWKGGFQKFRAFFVRGFDVFETSRF